MAVQLEGGTREELKTHFTTREGVYRLMTLAEFSRSNRLGYNTVQTNTPVKVSFVTLSDSNTNGDYICFNYGKELYIYHYRGIRKV